MRPEWQLSGPGVVGGHRASVAHGQGGTRKRRPPQKENERWVSVFARCVLIGSVSVREAQTILRTGIAVTSKDEFTRSGFLT